VGPGYAGSRISREALFNDDNDSPGSEAEEDEEEDEEFADPDDADINADDGGEDEDIDSDAAFGESDDEKFSKFTFRGSSHTAPNGVKKRPTASDFMSDSDNQQGEGELEGSEEDETDEDILDVDEQHPEEDGSEASEDEDDDLEQDDGSEEESDTGDKNGSSEKAKREELRKIMNEEQTTVIAAISQAAKDDANKGNAVKEQRKAFDSLLNVRIALQKALIATNSLTTVEEDNPATAEESNDKPYQAAEDAALKLWNILDGLRHELIQTSGSKKRKRDVVDTSTPSAAIWERMQDSEVSSLDNRRRVLEKWWGKVKGSAPSTTGKLIATAPTQTITSALQDQLAKPGIIENTRRPRSCAPVQEKQKLLEDVNIYDDTGFYKLLLNQLVEQRKADVGGVGAAVVTRAQWAVKEAKMRKVVDTKASKGRKLRYTVHEKLQNFMAPEDRTQWQPEAIDRFFGSLLGQKMTLGEEGVDGDGEGEDITPEEAGLRLFRS
jgi:protein AATF/BFR2